MPAILHVDSSPREESVSRKLAKVFMDGLSAGCGKKDLCIDTVSLFDEKFEKLPEFAAPAAAAKYAVMGGQKPQSAAAKAWQEVIRVIDRLKAADILVISAPMWNFSIPYKLKQFIDIVAQPELTFSFSEQEGYKGLLTGRQAVLCLARGGEYLPGSGAESMDMQKPYLELMLGFIGFDKVHRIICEPTLHGSEEQKRKAFDTAVSEAAKLSQLILSERF